VRGYIPAGLKKVSHEVPKRSNILTVFFNISSPLTSTYGLNGQAEGDELAMDEARPGLPLRERERREREREREREVYSPH